MPVNINNNTAQNQVQSSPAAVVGAPVAALPLLVSPVVYPAIVAVNGGSTAIAGVSGAVVIQPLVNPAAIAAYTINLSAPLPGGPAYIVVTCLGGITALTVTGAIAVPAGALAAANSSLILVWNGSTWVIG